MVGLVGMIGTAAASTTISPGSFSVNINTNSAETLTVTHERLTSLEPLADKISFNITDGIPGTTPTTELTGSWDGTLFVGNYGEDIAPAPVNDKYTWTFDIKDAIDADDAGQIGNTYTVYFTVWNTSTGAIGQGAATIGSSNTPGTAIPEFPTVALPIAAILGLMFIISSRKKKE